MPNAEDMKWFKDNFAAEVQVAIADTPFTLDLLVALACQETGHIWGRLRKKQMTLKQILALCVGDTIDAPRRSAFPKTKAALLAKPRGEEMFAIARKALEDMAVHIPGFPVSNRDKFCHGYGMFQYDLQFFLKDPDYFLERRYETFSQTLAKCVEELIVKAKKIGLFDKPALSDMELAAVAIAYNTGTFKPHLGLKQGFKNSAGQFYGELIFEFLRLSKTVPAPGGSAAIAAPGAGIAIVPDPAPVAATGPFLRVETQLAPLRVRSEPRLSTPRTANVIAQLPDGHPVRAVTGQPVRGFMEIETSFDGALIRGFASEEFLVASPGTSEIPVVVPSPTPPASGIVAVTMPRRSGTVTKRTAPAGAHSLNEDNMPVRTGTTAAELRASLATIIDFLAVDKASHKRYQPGAGKTFCNIYAHDYCLLANVYLPRVWWTAGAIEKLSQGQKVEPLISNTIFEMRANDLFRWLRDFGPRFGWRQAANPSELQQEANQGAVALIVARRKLEGRSGHIVAVAPETGEHAAKRNSAGVVTHPLQSQAGESNFRHGISTLNWWQHERFAESAFWLHA
jgi:hypothetical protein